MSSTTAETPSPSSRLTWWPAPLAGLLAMVSLIALQEGLNAVNQAFVSAPSAAAQTIVRLTPGAITNVMIETMGKGAIETLTASAYVGTALVGALLGGIALLMRRRGLGWSAIAGVLAGVPLLLYLVVAPSQARTAGNLGLSLVLGVVLAAVFAGVTLLLWRGFQPAAFLTPGTATDPHRRAIVTGGLAVVAIMLGGGWLARQAAGTPGAADVALTPLEPAASPSPAAAAASVALSPTVAAPPSPTTAPATVASPTAAVASTVAPAAASPTTAPPTAAPPQPTATAAPRPEEIEERYFASIKGLGPEITPIGKFYVVDEAIDDPRIDPASWKLTISGHIDKPMTLTFDQLRAMPFVDQYATLMCISYELGDDLVSNGKWRGVRIADLLKQVGVKTGATEVVLRSVDDFSESHSIERAMDPATILAYGMNDALLPRQHGAPLRAIVPGAYGFKHVKWITGMEVISGPPHRGYWEESAGWVQTGRLASAMSRIDTVDSPPVKAGTPATVAGIAFTSVRGISKVEVSDDGGKTWGAARLKAALSPLTWRLWAFEWKPTRAGKTTLQVRAYESDGTPQVATVQPSHPNGATGYHSIEVDVAP